MNIEDIFTADELVFIDSGSYTPGRAVLDAKLDLACAMEREACARLVDLESRLMGKELQSAAAIRARGQA